MFQLGENKKNRSAIDSALNKMRETLSNQSGLLFDGQPLTEEELASVLDAMKIGMERAKERNKKYTPKKYRDKR